MELIDDETWKNHDHYVSKSRLGLYKDCQLKFKKQYIDKCIPREENKIMSLGTRFHEFAEVFISNCTFYDPSEWDNFIHPDFTEEEVLGLKWFIDYTRKHEPHPLILEGKFINHEHKLRGIIDRIDQFDEYLDVWEYKRSKRIDKAKLQFEFGFYDLLLSNVDEFKDYKRRYFVMSPITQEVLSFTPSRKSTILNWLQKLNDSIANNDYKPLCKDRYALPWCQICSLEEISLYYGGANIRGINDPDSV